VWSSGHFDKVFQSLLADERDCAPIFVFDYSFLYQRRKV
jgi:hypothetical protein